MKQIIVNVSGLSAAEKQQVNEALAKITGFNEMTDNPVMAKWMYAPSSYVDDQITYSNGNEPNANKGPTHTPQQVLEMAGMAKQGHVHADLMAQYAEDAKTTDKPWELWEFLDLDGNWVASRCNPIWAPYVEYRRKPKTKLIHGVEIPDIGIDLSLTKERTDFCTPCVHNGRFFISLSHHKHNDCSCLSTLGLTYPYTGEGIKAAILHAKAMLGIA